MQHELKFYKAFREDSQLAECLLEARRGSPRHVVLLLHDALEFLFYECLLLNDVDIYDNGQSTIGFDQAYNRIGKLGYRLPYIATIRDIQKLRGDAKHHAQDVAWEKVAQLVQRWRIVCICVTWDIVSPVVRKSECDWAEEEYSGAQHLLYQRSRNKDWERALCHLIAAVAHRKCDVDPYAARHVGAVNAVATQAFAELVSVMSSGSVCKPFQSSQADIESLIKSGALEEACGALAQVYSAIQAEDPAEFDVKSATFITETLALASARKRAGMSWYHWSNSDTEGYREASDNIKKLLMGAPALVKSLGEPYCEHDDDRYRKWWEIVAFDGQEWHSFHMNHRFEISPESYDMYDDAPRRRERAARLAFQEFAKAAQQGHAAD